MKTFDELRLQAEAIRDAVNENENTAERVGGHLFDTVEKMQSLDIGKVADAVLQAENAAAEAKEQAEIVGQASEVIEMAKEQGNVAAAQGNMAEAAAAAANAAADKVTNEGLFKTQQDLSEEEQGQVKRNLGIEDLMASLETQTIEGFSETVNATTSTKSVDNIILPSIDFAIVDLGSTDGRELPTAPTMSVVLAKVTDGGRVKMQGYLKTSHEEYNIQVISGSAEKYGLNVGIITDIETTYKVFQIRYLSSSDAGKFKGSYGELSQLQSAYPTAGDGSYAFVGNPRHLYEWVTNAWTDRGEFTTSVDQAIDPQSERAISNKAVSAKLTELETKISGKINYEEEISGKFISSSDKISDNSTFSMFKYDISKLSGILTVTTPLKGNQYVRVWGLYKGDTAVAFGPVTTEKSEDTINLSLYDADTLYVSCQNTDKNVSVYLDNKQSIDLSSFAIRLEKGTRGVNIFNKNDLYENGGRYYINPSNGQIESTSYDLVVANYIEVLPDCISLVISASNNLSSTQGYRFLDKDKSLLQYGALSGSKSKILTIPKDAKYLQTTISKFNIDSLQIEYGTVPTDYVPFKNEIDTSELVYHNFLCNYAFRSKNLCDLSFLWKEKQYIGSDGAIKSTSYSLNVSYLILIRTDKNKITWSNSHTNFSATAYYRFLSSNGNIVSVGKMTGASSEGVMKCTVDIPYGARLLQITAPSDAEDLQVEYGEEKTEYEPFSGLKSSSGNGEDISDASIFLPVIKLADKKENVLYHNAIHVGRFEEKRLFKINTATSYGRFSVFRPLQNQDYETNTIIRWNNRTTHGFVDKQILTKIYSGAKRAGKTINVLIVGDSFTEIGVWVDTLIDLANEDDVIINTIGLMPTSKNRFNENQTGGTLKGAFMSDRYTGGNKTGKSYKVKVTGLLIKNFTIRFNQYCTYEANGAVWTVTGYKIDDNGDGYLRLTTTMSSSVQTLPSTGTLTRKSGNGDESIEYAEAEEVNRNPFWNPSTNQVDFSYYIQKWEFNEPDLLIMLFGWNDTTEFAFGVDDLVKNTKVFCDKFYEQYPNGKALFVVPPYGYAPAPISNNVNGLKYTRQYCYEKMMGIYNDTNKFDVCPSYMFVDDELGMRSEKVKPLKRFPDYEIDNAGDGIHNNDGAMQQIGDSAYPYILQYVGLVE